MKQVYKSEDGLVFDNKGECLKHEFKLNGGNEVFKELVNQAANEVEHLSGLKLFINEASAEVNWDGDPNEDEHNYVVWQTVNITAYEENGEQRGGDFSKGSMGAYTKELLIKDLLEEFHHPYLSLHEGVLVKGNSEDWMSPYNYRINGVNVEDVLKRSIGKRVRIEILD
ncbi:hypothetical protein FZC83_01760 [Rossellomorea marisflavi]|uniref:Uncharacterized protein n=1 Tax=Rossellomorea marisflavi TaxID=189381 RepID=A0A5D4S174_9BACI|nr:hypothetical protein [Rossellomorea marisflavi]TYS56321.1 hypothetical protein FZC83_01760 [Rossellomorea marisflavi]